MLLTLLTLALSLTAAIASVKEPHTVLTITSKYYTNWIEYTTSQYAILYFNEKPNYHYDKRLCR